MGARRVARNRRKPTQKKSRVSMRSVVQIGLGWLGVVALVLGLQHTWELVRTSTQLAVREISFQGNERLQSDFLQEVSGIKIGQPILTVSPDRVARRLEMLSWVADARVRRVFPNAVSITVRENIPAIVDAGAGPTLLGPDAKPFKTYRLTDQIDVPVFTAAGVAEVGDKLRGARLAQLYEEALGARVEEVHMDAAREWRLGVTGRELDVRLFLGTDPEAKRDRVVRFVEAAIKKRLHPKTIWFEEEIGSRSRIHVEVWPAPGAAHENLVLLAKVRAP